MFPGVKFWVGPPLETGFYYDIDLGDNQIGEENLHKLEVKMAELAKQSNAFVRKEISKADAVKYFGDKGDEYKLDLLSNLEDGGITLYSQGNFTDLCRGPHIPNTGFIKGIKLTNISGAYWKGDEKNKMLTRIYGVTFPTTKELDEYLVLLEEAKKRDHRKLGRELELFAFSEKVGMGLPLWLPKGTVLRERLEQFMRKAQIKAAADGRPRWFLDPLDGTVNYVHRLPFFAVSMGLLVDGVPEVAVVHAPALGETFHAVRGGGAFLGDERLAVRLTRTLGEAILATGFPYRRAELRPNNLENFSALFLECRDLRRFGSAALDLAYVAAGRLDAYWELWLAPHDVAAGALLVREAGGQVTDLDGGEHWLRGGHILAAGAELHALLRPRLVHG